MSDYKWIDVRALKMLHEESLSIHGGGRGVRDEGLFESAIMLPQNLIQYNEKADIADLAASYAYGLAKNHPFVDGNKRAAFLSPLLKTFVAPGFVDPYFLGSSKPRNLLIKIAKDNDPNKKQYP